MHIDTKTLLPGSIPTQNTHRLVVITAQAHPDEFARLEMSTADALAAARAALAAYHADPIADPALQPVIRALDDVIGRGRVLGPAFHDLADEALRYLSQIEADTMSATLCAIQRPLGEALTLALRLSDLLAAEREIGWHRGIDRDR
ncbi:hypothetical protein DKT77_03060 [Meridianimarinicoccus roseus]|uniref:Uncharacterized protein n=1 Tax=Meridianimarinicoccus roseus TaxID=2072018 RepID=A0A2V2LJ24_9RHOB|nr:hypothetical protein [Meridianimarinicoccus roseus]PWR04041.1 hypothetical protein DKT77_03060 [Meridianimarinicoccus roseus]